MFNENYYNKKMGELVDKFQLRGEKFIRKIIQEAIELQDDRRMIDNEAKELSEKIEESKKVTEKKKNGLAGISDENAKNNPAREVVSDDEGNVKIEDISKDNAEEELKK
jgi:hypothetical protein